MASKVDEDIKVLRQFIQIYCDTKHQDRKKTIMDEINLCEECHDIFRYSSMRREYCPLDPKPTCKNCKIHCYKPEYRQRIKEIMKHSGMILIKRGRLDLLLHYFF